MMDEDAKDNSCSTTDTKRCHHRMPSHHGSVEDVKDNNSFNHRNKHRHRMRPLTTIWHITQQYIPYSSSNIIIGKKECCSTNTYCQPTNSHLNTQQLPSSIATNLHQRQQFQPAHMFTGSTALSTISMKYSLKLERNLIESKCNQHNNSQHH